MVCAEGLFDDESDHNKLCKEHSLGISHPGYWKRGRFVYLIILTMIELLR